MSLAAMLAVARPLRAVRRRVAPRASPERLARLVMPSSQEKRLALLLVQQQSLLWEQRCW